MPSISCCIISVCCGSKFSKRVQLRTKITIMHAQHTWILYLSLPVQEMWDCVGFACEKKTDMEQFGKILIVDDNEDVFL